MIKCALLLAIEKAKFLGKSSDDIYCQAALVLFSGFHDTLKHDRHATVGRLLSRLSSSGSEPLHQ